MPTKPEYLAIRIGRRFALVTVDWDANQCTVTVDPKVGKRYGNAHSRLVVPRCTASSIKSCARDCAAQTFRTLGELRASVDQEFADEIRRAREFDS